MAYQPTEEKDLGFDSVQEGLDYAKGAGFVAFAKFAQRPDMEATFSLVPKGKQWFWVENKNGASK